MRRTVLLATVGAMAFATPSRAQNYDGDHQVRVGGFLGADWMNAKAQIERPAQDAKLSLNSVHGGITAGVEWIRRGWQWGLEGDLAPLGGHAKLDPGEFATNYLATTRGRLGMTLPTRPDMLVYATGGFSFLGVEYKAPAGFGTDKKQFTLIGTALGAGIEYNFAHNAILFGEYLGAFHQGRTFRLGSTGQVIGHVNDVGNHTLRIGFKFKVGHDWHGYKDDARDNLK